MKKQTRQPRSSASTLGFEEDEGGCGPRRRPQPIRAVDQKVDGAPDPGRDQLVDGRVDGRVLPADPHAGQEPEDEEHPGVLGRRRQDGGHQVKAQGDQEKPATAEAVGEVPEEEGTNAGAGHIDAGGVADLGRGDGDAAPRLGERAPDGTDDGDLEPVEDPDGAQANQHHPVPT